MNQLSTLQKEYAQLKAEQPRLRSRDAAQKLGISEAELLTLSLGDNVTRLEGDWKQLLKDVYDMGYVMALTRNEYVVHERKGVYDNVSFYEGHGNVGVAVNPDIDLRFFMNEWVYGFAITMERGELPTLYGFQFFNSRGEAVHKIYSTPRSNLEAYHKIVATYQAPVQEVLLDVDKSPLDPRVEKVDSQIDVAGFQDAWINLADTHHFFGMLKKYEVTRTQALRLAPEGYTYRVANDTAFRVLEAAAAQEVPIMVFVHSKGCVQIHTGEIKHLKWMDHWFNVLDPHFNLHLDTSAIHETWIVRKPTTDGIVTSLELFDSAGELIVYFFGKRKPGIPELESWRALIDREASVRV